MSRLELKACGCDQAARQRPPAWHEDPLFIAHWDRPLFIHFDIDPAPLQREVPFELDLWEGRARISLVAFTMRGMRLRMAGRWGEWLLKPVGTHEFLNLRTYVRHQGRAGIFFLTEWLPNCLCIRLGPPTFGLPYRQADIRYSHSHESGVLEGSVVARGERRLRYSARVPAPAAFATCVAGSMDEFLHERYIAFTARGNKRRFFRVEHEPWQQCAAEVQIEDRSLIVQRWEWFRDARLIGANYSPGTQNVGMGWPRKAGIYDL